MDGHRVLVDEAARDAGLRPATARSPTVGEVMLAGADLPAEERRCWTRGRARLGAPRATSPTTPSPCCAPGTERGWGVAVVCGAGINCVGVAPDGRRARFPALGRDHRRLGRRRTTSASPRSRRRPAARTAAARGPRSSAPSPAHFGMAGPAEVARGDPPAAARRAAAGRARAGRARARPADDAVAARDRRAAGGRGRRVRAVALGAARADGRERSTSCSAAACCARSTAASPRRSSAGSRRSRRARRSRLAADPPIVGAALLALDELRGRRRGAGAPAASRELDGDAGEPDAEAEPMAEVRYEQATRLPGHRRAGGGRARPRHRATAS